MTARDLARMEAPRLTVNFIGTALEYTARKLPDGKYVSVLSGATTAHGWRERMLKAPQGWVAEIMDRAWREERAAGGEQLRLAAE